VIHHAPLPTVPCKAVHASSSGAFESHPQTRPVAAGRSADALAPSGETEVVVCVCVCVCVCAQAILRQADVVNKNSHIMGILIMFKAPHILTS